MHGDINGHRPRWARKCHLGHLGFEGSDVKISNSYADVSTITLQNAGTAPGTVPLADEGSLRIWGLTGGLGMQLVPNSSNRTIAFVAQPTTLADAGGAGASLVATTSTAPAHVLKNLVAGTGLALTSSDTLVTLNNTAPHVPVTLADAGGVGESLVAAASTAPAHVLKTLAAGTGLALTASPTLVTLTNTAPHVPVTLGDSGGTGVMLVETASTAPVQVLRNLVASTGLLLTSSDTLMP